MSMALAAIADDGDLLAFDQVQVGIAIVINTHDISTPIGPSYFTLACAFGRFPVLLLGFMGGKDKSAAGGRTPQRRFALDLAQPVKMSAGLGNLRLVADGPGAERRNRVQQIAAERCQRIIDPRGNSRKYSAGNEPIAL